VLAEIDSLERQCRKRLRQNAIATTPKGEGSATN